MSNGGKRLKELIRQRGFRLGAVTEAIDVAPSTMDRWTDNAPIGKLVKLSKFTGIPLMDVINCLVVEDDAGANSLIPEQQHEHGIVWSSIDVKSDRTGENGRS